MNNEELIKDNKLDYLIPEWWSSCFKQIKILLIDLVFKNFEDTISRDCILNTMEMCELHHQGQKRMGGEPYVIHPYRVAIILMKELKENRLGVILAALMHDLIEDTSYQVNLMLREYGEETTQIVINVTRTCNKSKHENIDSEYFKKYVTNDERSFLLKLADKIDNTRDARNCLRDRTRRVFLKEGYLTYIPLIYKYNHLLDDSKIYLKLLTNALLVLQESLDNI